MSSAGPLTNQVNLAGTLLERGVLRFTPAGVPILDARVSHRSRQEEAGVDRDVALDVTVVFAGALAEMADRLRIGQGLEIRGFLAPRRRQSRTVVVHAVGFDVIGSGQLKTEEV